MVPGRHHCVHTKDKICETGSYLPHTISDKLLRHSIANLDLTNSLGIRVSNSVQIK